MDVNIDFFFLENCDTSVANSHAEPLTVYCRDGRVCLFDLCLRPLNTLKVISGAVS